MENNGQPGPRKASPLPPPRGSDLLSAEQWGILAAISATVIPSLAPCTGNRLLQHPVEKEAYAGASRRIAAIAGPEVSNELVDKYLGENAFDQPAFRENVCRLISDNMDETSRKGLLFILSALK